MGICVIALFSQRWMLENYLNWDCACACVSTKHCFLSALMVAGNLFQPSCFENQCDWRTSVSHAFWCDVGGSILSSYSTRDGKVVQLAAHCDEPLCVNTDVSRLSVFTVASTGIFISWLVLRALTRCGFLVWGCIPSRWHVLHLVTSFVFLPLLLRWVY